MKKPTEWHQACEQIGKTRSSYASWLLQFCFEAPPFNQLDSGRQESVQWQLQAFLDDGKWQEGSKLWIDIGFTKWWYTKLREIFSTLQHKKPVRCGTRLVQTHTAAIDECTRTMKLDVGRTAQGCEKGSAIHRVFCTLDGILRRCARCDQFFIRTGRQQYCRKQCSNLARLHRYRKKNTPPGTLD